jgi:hypothetical protein
VDGRDKPGHDAAASYHAEPPFSFLLHSLQ